MKLRSYLCTALVLLSSIAASALAGESRKTYIIQLQDQPVASYAGGVANMAATQPTPGRRINFNSAVVADYVQYLDKKQNQVISTVAKANIIAKYDTVLNGFAARLTDAEVLALKNNPQVLNVQADEAFHPDTISTSHFLGLDSSTGLWSTLGGRDTSGEGMVVGIIDGGIWPENPAFADRIDSNKVPTLDLSGMQNYGPAPATWKGGCDTGPGFDPSKHCNNKLIGARYYSAGFKASNSPVHWTEFLDSPRDSVAGATGHGGHGDHTASTVAGNYGAMAIVNGVKVGVATGMAPRARVAAYKICWTFIDPTATDGTGSRNTCYGSDAVSAIDQAVKDGVNVLNYSISGGENVNDPVEQAFLRAANAGIFVAASGGNSGPANQIAHISPWLTTVAASTHDRSFKASVTLSDAAASKFYGESINDKELPATQLIRAEDAGVSGANANELRFCFSNSVATPGVSPLDPVKVAGKIVICTRGSNARVDKSAAVLAAGGVGMILVDNGAGLVADTHSVPTVHVTAADGALIRAYVDASGAAAMASISKFSLVSKPAPIIAGFSSRGPNRFDVNQLKPDLTAPGVDIIASVTPGITEAQKNDIAAGLAAGTPEWASYQGTSMSSPHVAGLATLLRQQHPNWSPAAIKSALMTTATPTLDDGLPGLQNGKLPWSQGAGHVNPNGASDPGLIYDLGKNDYIKYQCKVNPSAVTPASDCVNIGTLGQTYNLNLPSITASNLIGPTTVTREVTNVGSVMSTYTAEATLAGFNVVVTPSVLTLAPGAKASFSVTLTPTTAVENVWAYGSLIWSDAAGHFVKSPLTAAVGKAVVAPNELFSDRASGSKIFSIKTGFSGRPQATKGGLKAASLSPQVTLTPEPLSSADATAVCTLGNDTASVKVHRVTATSDTLALRFALRNQDTSAPGADDFDLVIIKPNGTSIYSGNLASTESLQIAAPAPGEYKLCVIAYGTDADSTTMSYQLSSWLLTPADLGGNFAVALPGKTVTGGNAMVGVSWSELIAGERYLGAVQFLDLNGVAQATTVLRVEPGESVPVATSLRASGNLKR
jgi:subtilisin family serine protease